jgi:hypothetical protein
MSERRVAVEVEVDVREVWEGGSCWVVKPHRVEHCRSRAGHRDVLERKTEDRNGGGGLGRREKK